MQPIQHEPEVLRGLEILNFENVELEKVREDGAHTFATLGNLSVFYFDYFERFILMLNNWRYCLLPKLNTTTSSQLGMDTRNFVMPAYDGTYTIKLSQFLSPAALQNFETILRSTTKFNTGAQQESTIRQEEMIVGNANMVYTGQQVSTFGMPQQLAQSSYPGAYSSTYSSNNPSTVNSSTASSNVKKSKFKTRMNKMKKKFTKKPKNVREPNLNMTQVRDFESIRLTPESMVNIVEFRREEIETAIVSTKEIIKKREVPATLKEEIKEKVVDFVDVVKEGVHDIKERMAGRHEHEAQTGEKIGVMEILKDGIHEMKDKLTKKGHLDDGEIEPPEDPNRQGTFVSAIKAGVQEFKTKMAERREQNQDKPGIIDTMKHGVHDLKERAAMRHELAGEPAQVGIMDIVKEGVLEMKEKAALRHELAGEPAQVGIIDIVKEGVLEIKEKFAKRGQEEIVVTEKVETITPTGVTTTIVQDRYSGIPHQETRLGAVSINEPPRVYERPEGRLKIFDDKYLDQPLNSHPFPISGEAGKDMVSHYNEYSRPVEALTVQTVQTTQTVPVETVTMQTTHYEKDNSHLSIIDRIKASLPSGDKGHLPVKETRVPEGHASGNISDRIKEFTHFGTPNTGYVEPASKPGIIDQLKAKMPFIAGPPGGQAHSPVKKRELFKAALPVFFKGTESEEIHEQGRLETLARAGGVIGIAKAGGTAGLTGTALPVLMKKKPDGAVDLQSTSTEKPQVSFMDRVKNAVHYKGKQAFHEPTSQSLAQEGVIHHPHGTTISHVDAKTSVVPSTTSTVIQHQPVIQHTPVYESGPKEQYYLPGQVQPEIHHLPQPENLTGTVSVESRIAEQHQPIIQHTPVYESGPKEQYYLPGQIQPEINRLPHPENLVGTASVESRVTEQHKPIIQYTPVYESAPKDPLQQSVAGSIPVQSRIVERRSERPIETHSVISEQVYEVYQG